MTNTNGLSCLLRIGAMVPIGAEREEITAFTLLTVAGAT